MQWKPIKAESLQAPPRNSIGVMPGMGDAELAKEGWQNRVYVEEVAVSHLTSFGSLAKIDKQKLSTGGIGHIEERHVAKSWEYLQGRILNEETFSATSFSDERAATACISLTLDAHETSISKFLSDPEATSLQLYAKFSESVGYGVVADDITEKLQSRFVQVWIAKNPPGSARPYEVITAFPDMTPRTGNLFAPWSPPTNVTKINDDQGSNEIQNASSISSLKSAFSSAGKSTLAEWKATTSVAQPSETRATFYGAQQLPGGIILNPGEAKGLDIRSFEISLQHPGRITINGRTFDSELTYEELYRIAKASEHSSVLAATSTSSVEGTKAADIVGATLRMADEKLGGLVFKTWREDPVLELDAVLKLKPQELAARIAQKVSRNSAVVSLEFKAPDYVTDGHRLVCVNAPFKIHFIPFVGSTSSPKFSVRDVQIDHHFPSEMSVVREIGRAPKTLFSHSDLFARVQRYAAVLALFNNANARKTEISNLAELHKTFENKSTVIGSINTKLETPVLGVTNLDLVKNKIRLAREDKDFLRVIGASFLYVVSRDPSVLPLLEELVREELIKRVPQVAKDEPVEFQYLRHLTCSLALGAQSLHSETFKCSKIYEASFEGAAQEIATLFASQKIDPIFQALWRMPFHSSAPQQGSFSPAGWSLIRTVNQLCQLGYGVTLRELFLTKLSELAVQNPAGLVAVDNSIKAALGRCIELTHQKQVSLIEGGLSNFNYNLPQEIYRRFFEVSLVGLSVSKVVVNGRTFTSEIYAANEVAKLRSSRVPSDLNISDNSVSLALRFAEHVRILHTSIDWKLFDERKVQFSSPTLTTKKLTGISRIEREGQVLGTFGRQSASETAEYIEKYSALISACTAYVRSRSIPNADPITLVSLASKFLFRHQRIKLTNIHTLCEGIKKDAYDCDASCHIYLDVLQNLGVAAQFIVSHGHAHLAIGETHFEARGGEFISEREAQNRYGLMWNLSGVAVAEAIGAIGAISSVFNFDELGSFRSQLEMKAFFQASGEGMPAFIGGSDVASKIQLTPIQLKITLKAIQAALIEAPHDLHVLSHCNMALEVIANQKDKKLWLSTIESAQGLIAQNAFNLLNKLAAPPVCLYILRQLHTYLRFTPEQKLQLKAQLSLLDLPLPEDFLPTETSKSGEASTGGTTEKLSQFLWGNVSDPAVLAGKLFKLKNASLEFLKLGIGADASDQVTKEITKDYFAIFNDYIGKLQRAPFAPDREVVGCVFAWAAPNFSDPRASASLQLLGRHYRSDLSLIWANSVTGVRQSNDPSSTVQAARALSFFGDIGRIEAFQNSLDPFVKMMCHAAVEEVKNSAVNKAVRFSRNLSHFINGGYKSPSTAAVFIDQMEATGALSQKIANQARQDLGREGQTINFVCNLLANIKTHPALTQFKAQLIVDREYNILRQVLSREAEGRKLLLVIDALQLREQGKYNQILAIKDQLELYAKDIYFVPIMVMTGEAVAYSGDIGTANVYLKLANKNPSVAKMYAGYIEEFSTFLLISQGKISEAFEKVKNLESHPTGGFFRHTLTKYLYEKAYPELATYFSG